MLCIHTYCISHSCSKVIISISYITECNIGICNTVAVEMESIGQTGVELILQLAYPYFEFKAVV